MSDRSARRSLWEERALLYRYCWEHAVGACVSCARTFRQNEMVSDLIGYRCPRCRRDLTDTVHGHLYGCAALPVRRRPQRTREAARTLGTQSLEPIGRADALTPEAEVPVAVVRDGPRPSTSETLRHLARRKLEDGSLPAGKIPATISGSSGDGSTCGVCQHVVTRRDLMMVISTEGPARSASHGMTPIPLHADCFQVWNDERRTLKPNGFPAQSR